VSIIRSLPPLHMQPLVTVWCCVGCVLQPCSVVTARRAIKRYNSHSGCILTTKKNTEALVVAAKKIGLVLNAENIKYRFVSPKLHAGKNHHINMGNKSFERVGRFIRRKTTLTNKNSFHEKKKIEETEVRDSMSLFGAEFFVFQFAVQKYKDQL
jgi:hypothetical protein